MLFTRSNTIGVPSFPTDNALPNCWVYTIGDPVFLSIITPSIPSTCTPSFNLSTLNKRFIFSPSSLNLFIVSSFSLSLFLYETSYILVSPTFSNHLFDSCIFLCISFISLQNTIYFPSFLFPAYFANISSNPSACSKCLLASSMSFLNSFFVSSFDIFSILLSALFISSCNEYIPFIYIGASIIPSATASSNVISDATFPLNIASAISLLSTALIGVAVIPNIFAFGLCFIILSTPLLHSGAPHLWNSSIIMLSYPLSIFDNSIKEVYVTYFTSLYLLYCSSLISPLSFAFSTSSFTWLNI